MQARMRADHVRCRVLSAYSPVLACRDTCVYVSRHIVVCVSLFTPVSVFLRTRLRLAFMFSVVDVSSHLSHIITSASLSHVSFFPIHPSLPRSFFLSLCPHLVETSHAKGAPQPPRRAEPGAHAGRSCSFSSGVRYARVFSVHRFCFSSEHVLSDLEVQLAAGPWVRLVSAKLCGFSVPRYWPTGLPLAQALRVAERRGRARIMADY